MLEKEYIDLEETVVTLKRNSQKYFSSFHKGYVQAIEDLADIPAAKVAPVRHGYFRRLTFSGDIIICSECKMAYNIFETNGAENFDYCPNCGAKMDGKECDENA